MIQYVKHKAIDKQKWDNAIIKSFNRLPFALSWYLDIASPDWDALIYDDYLEVMPLTHRKKAGINYLFQPMHCHRLGVFSTLKNDAFSINNYIEAIPSKFKLVEISINEHNFIIPDSASINSILKTFQVIESDISYADLKENYSKSHLKNITKFQNTGSYQIDENYSFVDFYNYSTAFLEKKVSNWTKKNNLMYFNLLSAFNAKNKLDIRMGKDENNNVLGGICVLKFDFNRIGIQTFSTASGRKSGVMFYLIDQIIETYLAQNTTIDFMGSTLNGVRERNLGFGSIDKNYQFVKLNHLNFLLKLLKSRA